MRLHKIAGLVCASAFVAMATPVTYTFTGNGGTAGGSSPFGNTRTYTSGLNSVTVACFRCPVTWRELRQAQLGWYAASASCNNTGRRQLRNPEHQWTTTQL